MDELADAAVSASRRSTMGILADGETAEIARGLAALGASLDGVEVRPTETGLVMVRGRIGGDGRPFNLGEVPVTRAAVRIASGQTGFSYVLGRDVEKARLCAICDALWQDAARRDAIEHAVLAPIRRRVEQERMHKRAQTASTRVDFFTLVRGEDE